MTLTEKAEAFARQKHEGQLRVGGEPVTEHLRRVAQIVAGHMNWSSGVIGTTPSLLVVREWELTTGRPFTVQDVKSATKVALLGQTVGEAFQAEGVDTRDHEFYGQRQAIEPATDLRRISGVTIRELEGMDQAARSLDEQLHRRIEP